MSESEAELKWVSQRLGKGGANALLVHSVRKPRSQSRHICALSLPGCVELPSDLDDVDMGGTNAIADASVVSAVASLVLDSKQSETEVGIPKLASAFSAVLSEDRPAELYLGGTRAHHLLRLSDDRLTTMLSTGSASTHRHCHRHMSQPRAGQQLDAIRQQQLDDEIRVHFCERPSSRPLQQTISKHGHLNSHPSNHR